MSERSSGILNVLVLQVLTALAARRNGKALPELPKRYGLRLPGREDCLLEPGYAPSRQPGHAGARTALFDVDRSFAPEGLEALSATRAISVILWSFAARLHILHAHPLCPDLRR